MKVLFADDQADDFIARFNRYIGEHGLTFVKELEAEKVLARIRQEKPDVLLLDILFPVEVGTLAPLEPKGKDVFSKVRRKHPNLPVVVLTSTLTDAQYGINTADFPGAFLFEKDRFREDDDSDPYEELAEALLSAIEKASDIRPLDERFDFFIGETPSMRRLAEEILKIAESEARTVLLIGERGTGKEKAAEALKRRDKPYKPIDIAALPSEQGGLAQLDKLFGHAPNTPPWKDKGQPGIFEEVNGGTVFLDEIGDALPEVQSRLKRVIQERIVERIGSSTLVEVDVRIIAATNKDLPALAREGRFHSDLYDRLGLKLKVPPLRERLKDLEPLCAFLINDLNEALKKRPRINPEVRGDVLEKLKGHSWPGNIRDLRNVLEHAMVLAPSTSLTSSDINFEMDDETPPGLPEGDWVDRILAGEVDWEELKDIQGAPRKRIFEDLISRLTERDGKLPTSADLAALLKTRDGNMRRILKAAGISLRALKQTAE